MKLKKNREQRRYDRRTARVPVREANWADASKDLGMYTDRKYMPSGYYERESGLGKGKEEIVIYPRGGEDVLRHEQQHVAQTSRLARMLGLEGRVQNKDVRQAARALKSSMPQTQYDSLNQAGRYFAGQPMELEATVKSIRPGLEAAGIERGQDFDSMLDSLKLADNENMLNTNMRNLMLMMDNPWNEEQKNLIMSAINYDM